MSRRDLIHILNAMWRLSGGAPGVGVPVTEIELAIGRGRGDMRTPLNLQSLVDESRVVQLPDGNWALTLEGVDWLEQDRELSDR